MTHQPSSTKHQLHNQAKILGTCLAIFWLLEIVDLVIFQGHLNSLGIQPRRLIGLRGIAFAPFLHANLAHLMANTIPFVVLGWFVMLQETSDFYIVTFLSALIGGLGVWFFGASGVHLGASILIFGYLGFLLLRGYFQRNLPSILLSIVIAVFYGGMLWGLLPLRTGISWEGHLFGFLGGVIAARAIAKEKQMYDKR